MKNNQAPVLLFADKYHPALLQDLHHGPAASAPSNGPAQTSDYAGPEPDIKLGEKSSWNT